MSIGENIKKYRKQAELTQKELAEKANLSESAIKYYESNRRNPKLETLDKIGDALGISINYLTSKEEKKSLITEEIQETKQLLEQLMETPSDEEYEIILKLVKHYNDNFYNNEFDINKFDKNQMRSLKIALHGIIRASLRDCIK